MRAILTSVDELAQALENPEPLVGKKGKSRGRRRSARSD
jgi:hypothetical protein